LKKRDRDVSSRVRDQKAECVTENVWELTSTDMVADRCAGCCELITAGQGCRGMSNLVRGRVRDSRVSLSLKAFLHGIICTPALGPEWVGGHVRKVAHADLKEKGQRQTVDGGKVRGWVKVTFANGL